jgi:hypothetical protein
MNVEFPYQVVAFLDNQPEVGESVYYGENGWYSQIALKRRFKTPSLHEDELIAKLKEYFSTKDSFTIETKGLIQPDRMPVKVLEVVANPELISFHNDFITFMGTSMVSRYPGRDGANYLPHITAEYDDKMVIDTDLYSNKNFVIHKVYLLKDINDENSIAYKFFELN